MKTFRSIRGLALTGVAALGLIAMTPAMADSDFATGNGAISASADLQFRVIVPQFIDFRVGSTGTTVDDVDFTVGVNDIGNGTAVSRDGGAAVGVALRSNAGNITLAAAGPANLTNGNGDTIAWSQITGTSSEATLPVPTVGGSANLTASAGVINRTADWTFSYENDNLVGAGTYAGTVTYTASAP